jgi:hypothetical protein
MIYIFRIIFAISIIIFIPFMVYAQGPTPSPPTPEIPYTFEPLEYQSTETNTTAIHLTDLMTGVPFINGLGSIMVTVWSMLDDFAGGGVLGYFIMIICGVWVIKWLSNFVFKKNASEDGSKSSSKTDDPATLPRTSHRKQVF